MGNNPKVMSFKRVAPMARFKFRGRYYTKIANSHSVSHKTGKDAILSLNDEVEVVGPSHVSLVF